jgi:hypothetical protein
MSCPLCGTRKARRACPALGQRICPVCCGTKRLVEIACPPDCGYLASARLHPPATVVRQRERDLAFAHTVFEDLGDAAYALVLYFQAVLAQYRKTSVFPVTDAEVAAAAATAAATLETAARGIIYEHQTTQPGAQRLVTELQAALDLLQREGRRVSERDASIALRRIEQSATGAAPWFGGSPSAFLDFVERLPEDLQAAALQAGGGARPEAPAEDPSRPASRIILP